MTGPGGPPPHRRWPARAPGLVLLLTLVLLGTAAAPTAGSPGAGPSSVPSAVPLAVEFASSAGYSTPLLGELQNIHPSDSEQQLVVSFHADPALFDYPVSGAPPLTETQIADRFGLSPSAFAAAESYFESQGLTVARAGPDRLSLSLAGSAAAVDRAFATTLEAGTVGGRAVQTPGSPPALPARIEKEVAGVVGLSTGWNTFSLPLSPLHPAVTGASGHASNDLVTPAVGRLIYDASELYNVSGSSHFAKGEGIVVLLWGDGYDPSDIATFWQSDYPKGQFPAPTVVPYPIDGAPAPSAAALNDPSMAPQELTLDIEWSGSFAPGATIDAVYAPDGAASDGYSPTDASMADALGAAVNSISGVDVISMSFGTSEATAAGLEAAWQNDFAEAAQKQITLLAATGDTGGDTRAVGGGCSGVPQPEYPSTDPNVIAVGGTDPALNRNVLGAVTGLSSEAAWSGSGGGFSQQYSAPSWQEVGSAAGPIGANGHRGIPDVAAAAAQDFVFYGGQPQAGAGTSFATPLWAGLVAEMDSLHGSSLGFVTPRIYAFAANQSGASRTGIADITSGANCIGPAGPGWDPATGWGSPRALILYEGLTATFVNLNFTNGPGAVGPGQVLTVTLVLSNSTSGRPIAGVPVQVTITADTPYGPCAGTFGQADPTTNVSGEVSVSVTVPACYLGSKAIVSAQVTSNGLYGTTQTTVGVNLLAFLGPLATYPMNVVVFVLIMVAAIAIGAVLGRRRPPRPARIATVPAPGAPPAPDVATGPSAQPPPEPEPVEIVLPPSPTPDPPPGALGAPAEETP